MSSQSIGLTEIADFDRAINQNTAEKIEIGSNG